MLEKPDLPDEKLISCLRDEYGLDIVSAAFLPIGDSKTAIYRVVAGDAASYFLKLRRDIEEASVAIPRLLSDRGIAPIIAPIETSARQLRARLDEFAIVLYPFVSGRNGFEAPLSERQWVDLGAALKGVHTTAVPDALDVQMPHEAYSPTWRAMVRVFQHRAEGAVFGDPIAAELAAWLQARRQEISDLVRRAEQLAAALQARSLESVLCHTDLHAGNVLIDANDALYIVDWDAPILGPKERDLMFIGGGVGGVWNSEREETLFYRGYGPVEVDRMALAYFRYERIVEDIAVYCEQLFLSDDSDQAREEGLRRLLGVFEPNAVVERAYASDRYTLTD